MRPRKKGHQDLQGTNIIVRKRGDDIYYYWFDLRDGKEKSLKAKNNKTLALQRAATLNAAIAEAKEHAFFENVNKPQAIPFNAFAPDYLAIAEKRGLAENTMRSKRSLLNKWINYLGDTPINVEINALMEEMSIALDTEIEEGRHRQALAMHSLALDLFKTAQSKGKYPLEATNPASILERPKASVKRARLSLDEFQIIIDKFIEPWERNACLLALISGQGREDMSLARFKRGKDWHGQWEAFKSAQAAGKKGTIPYSFIEDGYYHATRRKTGSLRRIPLTLKLDAIGMTLGDAIKECRSSGVASQWLLHHSKSSGVGKRGDQIHKDTISRMFARLRKRTTLTWTGNPPTYHEIRSLSIRLYTDQYDSEFAQALVAHKELKTTAIYQDTRSAEWEEVIIK